MIRYLVRRLFYAVPILIGVSLLTFLLFYCAASPEAMARHNLSVKNPTPDQIHQWLADRGYDQPLSVQFKKHMTKLVLLDFGKSDRTKEPIWGRIRAGTLPSMQLAGLVILGSLLVSLTVSLISAYFRGTYIDGSTTIACVVLLSVVYVVYVIGLQFVLAKLLRYGPLAGYHSGWASWGYVLLPAAIGIVARIGNDIRLYRTFILEEINQDYVRTARAKGVPERIVLFKHVLKNAMVPVLTSTVASIPLLILGSLILETFFGIPGLGNYLQDAIQAQDFAVVRAMVYLGAILTIAGFLLTDILYGVFDPRVRLE